MNNNINTKLSLLYDDDFNAKYDYSNRLNKEIILKDKIINIYDKQGNKSKKSIKILKIIMIMTALLIFIAFLISTKIFDKKFGTSLMVIIIVIYVIRILIFRYTKKSNFTEENKLTGNYFRNKDKSSKKSNCPKRCRPKPVPVPTPIRIKEKVRNNLKTDSSLNSWVYGDQPEALYYNPRIYGKKYPNYRIEGEDSVDSPEPWFNKISDNVDSEDPIQGVTYYNCVKELSPEGTQTEFRTTIPCKYYPGYKTHNRCIFDKDNNCNIV